MNFLTIVNKVLLKLRKTALTSSNFSTDSYGLLIQQFVNESKKQVEDGWNWSMLRQTATVTLDGTNHKFVLPDITQRSRSLDAWNTTKQSQMFQVAQDKMRALLQSTSQPTGDALWYTLVDDSTQTDNSVVASVYPYKTSGQVLEFFFLTPQDDLADFDDNLYIPEQPVIDLAYAFAVGERGEDGGITFTEAYSKYETSLAQAIAIDSQRQFESADWKVM